MGQKIEKKKIGELLIEIGKITDQDLEKALVRQKNTDKKVGQILVEMDIIQEEDLITCLAKQYQTPYININNYEITQDILNLIPKGLAKKYSCLPLDKIGNIISCVVADPTNMYELKQQEAFLNCKIQFFVTEPSVLDAAIKKHYGN